MSQDQNNDFGGQIREGLPSPHVPSGQGNVDEGPEKVLSQNIGLKHGFVIPPWRDSGRKW